MFVLLVLLLFFVIAWVWRRRWARRQRTLRIRQLRAWVANHHVLDPAVQQWMQRLSAAEAEELLQLLQGYCTSLNWELNWLFAPQIKKAPALKIVLEESISAYIHAILVSLQMEEDVQAYQAYLAFEKKPTARKQGAFVEALYRKIDHGQLPPSAKTRLSRFMGKAAPWKAATSTVGPRKAATRKEQVAAIQQAFEHDPARTMAALKAVLVSDSPLPLPPEQQLFTSALAVPSVAAPA
jgi:hypothetical protein